MVNPSQAFTKTWRLTNIGVCTWTTDYKLVFVSGDKMGSPDALNLPVVVAPGQTLDLSVNLIAPASPGKYQGNWELQSSDGKIFGTGTTADKPIWAIVRVLTQAPPTSTPPALTLTLPPSTFLTPALTPSLQVTYDFAQNACEASWSGNDGVLPCPGKDGDSHGFVLILNQSKLEDGTTTSLPALLTFPQASASGYIQAVYPAYQVQAGDHFQTTASCEYGANSCSVLYRVSVQDEAGKITDLWVLGEFYDGSYTNVDLDLASLAGQKVRFILNISSLGSATGDRALWVAPRIVNFPPGTATPSSTPRPSVTAPAPSKTPAPPFTRTPVPATPSPTPSVVVPGPTPTPAPSVVQQVIDFINSVLQRLFGK